MRYSDCNKFVSYDEPEVEIDGEPDVDGNRVTGQVRIVLKCADCGNELKDAELEYECEIDHDCAKAKKDQEPTLTPTGEPEGSPTSCTQTTCKVKGKVKQITRARYMKRFYGAEINGSVTCDICEETIEYSATVEEQASGFNEM